MGKKYEVWFSEISQEIEVLIIGENGAIHNTNTVHYHDHFKLIGEFKHKQIERIDKVLKHKKLLFSELQYMIECDKKFRYKIEGRDTLFSYRKIKKGMIESFTFIFPITEENLPKSDSILLKDWNQNKSCKLSLYDDCTKRIIQGCLKCKEHLDIDVIFLESKIKTSKQISDHAIKNIPIERALNIVDKEGYVHIMEFGKIHIDNWKK